MSARCSDHDRHVKDATMNDHDSDVIAMEEDTKESSVGSSDDSGTPSEANAPVSCNYEYLPDGWPGFLFDDRKPLSSEQCERIRNIERAARHVNEVIRKYGNAPLPSLGPMDAGENGWKIDEGSAWADASSAVKEIVNAREELARAWDAGAERKTNSGRSAEMPPKEEWWKPILAKAPEMMKNSTGCDEPEEDDNGALIKEEEELFQKIHMEWATTAFTEELEAVRTGRLEALTSARKQKKGAAGRDDLSALGLDPNQHSFVLASGDASREKQEGASAEEVDVRVLAEMVQSGSHFLSTTEKKMLLGAGQRAAASFGDTGAGDEEDGISLHERRRRQLGFVDDRGNILNPFA